MAIEQPNFNLVYASGTKIGEIKTMPVADYTRGWGYLATNEAPPMEYFNYLQNYSDRRIGYLFKSARIRESNKAYTIDCVITSPNLSSKFTLVCTQDGTTATQEPNYDNVKLGDIITDGSSKWKVAYSKGGVTTVNGKSADGNGNIQLDSLKNPNKLTIKVNGSTKIDYDGSTEQSVDITPSMLDIVNLIYPIGAIYISVSSTNPSTLFKGTVWRQIEAGYTLIQAGTSSWGETYSASAIGGYGTASHTIRNSNLPMHTHTASGSTNVSGGHTHTKGTMNIKGNFAWELMGQTGSNTRYSGAFYYNNSELQWYNQNSSGSVYGGSHAIVGFDASREGAWTGETSANGDHSHSVNITIDNSGGELNPSPISNMQPSIAVYMWQRTD